MAFPFLGLFIIFLSVAAYYRKRATAQQKESDGRFLEP